MIKNAASFVGWGNPCLLLLVFSLLSCSYFGFLANVRLFRKPPYTFFLKKEPLQIRSKCNLLVFMSLTFPHDKFIKFLNISAGIFELYFDFFSVVVIRKIVARSALNKWH